MPRALFSKLLERETDGKLHSARAVARSRSVAVPCALDNTYALCTCVELPRSPADGKLTNCRLESLEISSTSAIESVHEGVLTWLALDNVESRYLLASAADGSVAAYDTPNLSSANQPQKQLLFKLDRNSPGGHKFTVAGVTWYPIDTGLFVTGSFDQSVKVLRTNGTSRMLFCVPKAG